MSDDFLYRLRRAPAARFAESLHARLRKQETSAGKLDRSPMMRAAASVTVAVATGLLFLFPAVRTTAQQFLDWFRVTSFAAVRIDDQKVAQLTQGFDLERLIGNQVEHLLPYTSEEFSTAQEASAAIGFVLQTPKFLPQGLALATVSVSGEQAMRIVADVAALHSIMELLDIRDLRVPDTLDGQVAIVTLPRTASLTYLSDNVRLKLMQARSPQVSLPAGLDLPTLGEIGLRIMGVDPAEARRFAQNIDWTSTFIVPIPTHAWSFQQVSVRGHDGLQIQLHGKLSADGRVTRPESILMWSDGEYIYALQGNVPPASLPVIADSLAPAGP
jgi:hypothetical protein